ncbi:MAG: hypothetical protein INR71_09400 [Terriglobus roseus]|nr:hypothetical protein [Terriglobus roseus]
MDHAAALHGSTVALHLIYAMLDADPSHWEQHLPAARDIMRTLDALQFFDRPDALPDQLWFVQGLQRFAFHDPDADLVPDVATWCLRQWLIIHRRHPDHVGALRGQFCIVVLLRLSLISSTVAPPLHLAS